MNEINLIYGIIGSGMLVCGYYGLRYVKNKYREYKAELKSKKRHVHNIYDNIIYINDDAIFNIHYYLLLETSDIIIDICIGNKAIIDEEIIDELINNYEVRRRRDGTLILQQDQNMRKICWRALNYLEECERDRILVNEHDVKKYYCLKKCKDNKENYKKCESCDYEVCVCNQAPKLHECICGRLQCRWCIEEHVRIECMIDEAYEFYKAWSANRKSLCNQKDNETLNVSILPKDVIYEIYTWIKKT